MPIFLFHSFVLINVLLDSIRIILKNYIVKYEISFSAPLQIGIRLDLRTEKEFRNKYILIDILNSLYFILGLNYFCRSNWHAFSPSQHDFLWHPTPEK